MKTKTTVNPVLNRAASLTRKVAMHDSSTICFIFLHQPKAPANMEARLKAMDKRTPK
jgi:cyclic lactone autoinducer peptide